MQAKLRYTETNDKRYSKQNIVIYIVVRGWNFYRSNCFKQRSDTVNPLPARAYPHYGRGITYWYYLIQWWKIQGSFNKSLEKDRKMNYFVYTEKKQLLCQQHFCQKQVYRGFKSICYRIGNIFIGSCSIFLRIHSIHAFGKKCFWFNSIFFWV